MNDVVLEAAKRLAEAGVDSARLDARLLWEFAQNSNPPLEGSEGRARAQARPVGSKEILQRFEALIQRREAREPIAYILGRKEFWSLDFEVGPGVLVPRPDTETLIEEALRIVPDRNAVLHIADLGTGSGAILVAALKEFPNATGVGYESSPEALAYAEANAARLVGPRATISPLDWRWVDDNFDLIFCNPPYIPSADIESLDPDVSRFEPRVALDGGADGLGAYRLLGELLPFLLRPGGHALLEIGLGQAQAMGTLFQPLEIVRVAPDLSGIPRCVILRKP